MSPTTWVAVLQHVRDLALACAAKDNSIHLVLRPWVRTAIGWSTSRVRRVRKLILTWPRAHLSFSRRSPNPTDAFSSLCRGIWLGVVTAR